MAVKTPDSVSVDRTVIGSKTLVVLAFTTENLDDNDTVETGGYMSVVEAAWFQPNAAFATNMGIELTDYNTVTAQTGTANQTGYLFLLGTP